MNEAVPPTVSPEPVTPDYKDRSTGLTIFGILTILLGCLSGLFNVLMLAGQAMAAKTTQTPANAAAILPALATYGILTVALIWLGIGSIQARRWARALLLVFSWSWLLVGIVGMIMTAFVMPKVMGNLPSNDATNQPTIPPEAIGVATVFMFLFMGFFFIVLPAIWIFFYGSRHVKATCERRDGVPRWTDNCPLPVLAICLWLLFGVPMMLLMPLWGRGVMPFFGIFLTGLPGALLCLALAALWCYAAWMVYHLKSQGWWLILIAMIVLLISGLLTFARHDMLEMYQLQGYSQEQIEQIQKTGLLTGNRPLWMMLVCFLPFLGYLAFVKKYFREAGTAGKNAA